MIAATQKRGMTFVNEHFFDFIEGPHTFLLQKHKKHDTRYYVNI